MCRCYQPEKPASYVAFLLVGYGDYEHVITFVSTSETPQLTPSNILVRCFVYGYGYGHGYDINKPLNKEAVSIFSIA